MRDRKISSRIGARQKQQRARRLRPHSVPTNRYLFITLLLPHCYPSLLGHNRDLHLWTLTSGGCGPPVSSPRASPRCHSYRNRLYLKAFDIIHIGSPPRIRKGEASLQKGGTITPEK